MSSCELHDLTASSLPKDHMLNVSFLLFLHSPLTLYLLGTPGDVGRRPLLSFSLSLALVARGSALLFIFISLRLFLDFVYVLVSQSMCPYCLPVSYLISSRRLRFGFVFLSFRISVFLALPPDGTDSFINRSRKKKKELG